MSRSIHIQVQREERLQTSDHKITYERVTARRLAARRAHAVRWRRRHNSMNNEMVWKWRQTLHHKRRTRMP